MNRGPKLSIRRLITLLPLALLLLGGPIAGALHQHHGFAEDHLHDVVVDHCAICVHASAPATSVAGLPSAPAPVLNSECLPLITAHTPLARVLDAPASRGPPTA